jgi:hypothetical protein
LPKDLIEKQQSFLSFVLYHYTQYHYPLQFIGNIDKTPITFDLPNPTTIEHRSARTVGIRITSNERKNFTVVLEYMADGTKLLPVCIFKLAKIFCENFSSGVLIRVNKKSWMNEHEMLW